jgi:hypothetical protein
MTTRETSAIFSAIMVAVTAITLLTSTSASFVAPVLAAKTNPSHHKGSGATDNNSVSGNTDSSTNDNTPPSTSNNNENLKNLFACESAAANASGKLTKADLINCYSQTSSDNSASSGNSNGPGGDIGTGSSSGSSGSDSGPSSSSSHTHHHHDSSRSTSDSTTGSSEGP